VSHRQDQHAAAIDGVDERITELPNGNLSHTWANLGPERWEFRNLGRRAPDLVQQASARAIGAQFEKADGVIELGLRRLMVADVNLAVSRFASVSCS
jgi:hypothetical protein